VESITELNLSNLGSDCVKIVHMDGLSVSSGQQADESCVFCDAGQEYLGNMDVTIEGGRAGFVHVIHRAAQMSRFL
jgi:hypothetical protein